MKQTRKSIIMVALALVIAAIGIFAVGCSGGSLPFSNGGSFNQVCYYGCPNSKRVHRLNTKKNKR